MNDRHGCHNRKPFRTAYEAPNGLKCIKLHDEMDYIIVQKRAQVKHTMSRDCRHAKTPIMKIIYFTGLLIAWIIGPYIFIVLVPSFILMDFIIGNENTHIDLIKSWKKWAFNQHGIDNEPTK